VARINYGHERYDAIARNEMDEGMDYPVADLAPVPGSLKGIRLAILMGPCPEEPEIVVPLEFLKGSGAQVDVIAPDWTPHDWLPAARFWTPTIKIPYQKRISQALVDDYRGVILIGGTWNPAVVRTDGKMIAFLRESAKRSRPMFAICHGAQILISAGLVSKGMKLTGSEDIRADLRNAGATVIEDQPVVSGEGSIYVGEYAGVIGANFRVISSRNPGDLAQFCRAIAQSF
jgi:protease I